MDVVFDCPPSARATTSVDYPFRFGKQVCPMANNKTYLMTADVSSDAQFFVATGVLSFMYCIFIIAVYAFIDDFYKSKSEIPLADFMITTILAIFWLSGSAAWSNGTSALKTSTDSDALHGQCPSCQVWTGSFSRLNISLVSI